MLGDSLPSASCTPSQAHLSRVAADGDTKGSGQAKISQFQLPILRGDNTKGTRRRPFNWVRIGSVSFSPSRFLSAPHPWLQRLHSHSLFPEQYPVYEQVLGLQVPM